MDSNHEGLNQFKKCDKGIAIDRIFRGILLIYFEALRNQCDIFSGTPFLIMSILLGSLAQLRQGRRVAIMYNYQDKNEFSYQLSER